MGLFNDRIKNSDGKTQIPVWFMRQAGRYHQHYQNIKKDSDFMTMCKTPKLAQEITHGPIDEFKFDAAILFSDLLFPLEHLGMGLTYAPGPKMGWLLDSKEKIKDLKPIEKAKSYYQFQNEACSLLSQSLPKEKTLLGFVGAPWTLYTYAVEGGHSGNLIDSKKGIYDGRWEGFCEILFDNLLEEMRQQALGGAQGMCLFDTAVGELTLKDYTRFVLPKIKGITREFKKEFPDIKVVYYSKLTHLNYLREIQEDSIDVLGVDWRMDINECLNELGKDYYIQGNLDPSHLHLPWNLLEKKWMELWNGLSDNVNLNHWICGLGHGVLQKTPEENVQKSVELIHNRFLY